jgi:hypothetical protein
MVLFRVLYKFHFIEVLFYIDMIIPISVMKYEVDQRAVMKNKILDWCLQCGTIFLE